MTGDEAVVDDEARFRATFRLHYGAVLAYALRRTNSREDAEEVAASTFATAWRRVRDLPEEPATITWLYRVAWKTLANQRRGANRRSNLVNRLGGQRGVPGSEVAGFEDGDLTERLLESLRYLRPKDQEILRLVAWEELTHEQAASVLKCSANAFAIRLHRARRALHADLARRGLQYPGRQGGPPQQSSDVPGG